MMRFTWLGLLCACGGDHAAKPDAASIDAAPPPTLTAVAKQSTLARGATLTIDITLTNFVLIDPTKGRVPHAGEGHYHIFHDGDTTTYDAGWTPQLDIMSSPSEAPGDHSVMLQLVDGDHDPITPVVATTVHFTLQ